MPSPASANGPLMAKAALPSFLGGALSAPSGGAQPGEGLSTESWLKIIRAAAKGLHKTSKKNRRIIEASLSAAVHVAMDGSVYKQYVYRAAERLHGPGSWSPILIFIPLRLGLESMNPQYAPALAALFAHPWRHMVAGGQHAMHDVGWPAGLRTNAISRVRPKHVLSNRVSVRSDALCWIGCEVGYWS